MPQLAPHIYSLPGFLSLNTCQQLITRAEAFGFEAAGINTDAGQKVVEEVRNNNRVLLKDQVLADQLWQRVRHDVPMQLGNSKAVGLNELFRFYRYEPGQLFRKHRDESYIRDEYTASYYTFLIYLNADFEGGATRFDKLEVAPEAGMGLIFLHDLEHEGAAVLSGMKYVLRTDIMYQLADSK